MRYFPAFLDMKDKTVLIVGGGEEALRKARLFAKTEARIEVVAPALSDELAAMSGVTWKARRFEECHLEGATLVIVAEEIPAMDVIAAAKARRLPVNVVDHPDLSSFIVPSIVDRDPLVVAIGTEGKAPILGQGLRAKFDALLPQKLGALAAHGGSLRGAVAQSLPPGNVRRGFWQRFFFGDAGDAFLCGESSRFDLITSRLLHQQPAETLSRVSFVSAGEGDPELLTLKGHRRLQEADIIVHDADVPATVLELARRDATRFVSSRDFTANVSTLGAHARAGKLVVRLSLGGYAVEELANLAADGLSVEAIPGAGEDKTCDIIPFPHRDEFLRIAS